jgi:hypothetical protein
MNVRSLYLLKIYRYESFNYGQDALGIAFDPSL